MNDDEREAQWRCAVCGRWFVVPSLARLHENRHEKEGT